MMSLCLILPEIHQSSGNAIAVALGHDLDPGRTYTVALSGTGLEPATHYGCRTWATSGFVLMLDIARTGVVPPGTAQQLADMALWVRSQWSETVAALIFDVRDTDDPLQHWLDTIAANDLQLTATETI